ncbi:MAG: type II secretion system F family protein [Acidobacteriaceae bacterium]|nr:type II secretion system F family protein [Acidobacteriaceae bacterium]
MAEYLIRMADERGQVLEQVESGHSADAIRDHFSQQGYLVYSVKSRGLLSGGEMRLPQRKRIKMQQFVIYNQQFLTLVRAGLPILTALELLLKRQQDDYFKSILENVRDRVKSGELLSEAFAAQNVFPRIYTTTLLAGEKSGNLEEVLSRYIAFQRVALSVRKKLLASLIYPAILVTAVICMFTFLFTFVVPRFADLYHELGANLPAITTFMLNVGVAMRKYFPIIVVAVAAVIFGIWRWAKSRRGAERLDRIRLALPLLGDIWLKYQVGIFTRMLSTLLSGGLPLVPALETAGASMQSRQIANAIVSSSQKVRQGRPLSKSLEETETFPSMAVEMIEVGESTGALPAMLNSVAEFYEEDVQTALAATMSLIEPLLLLIVAVVVGVVLISLYYPIFTLGAGGIRPS